MFIDCRTRNQLVDSISTKSDVILTLVHAQYNVVIMLMLIDVLNRARVFPITSTPIQVRTTVRYSLNLA